MVTVSIIVSPMSVEALPTVVVLLLYIAISKYFEELNKVPYSIIILFIE